MNIDPKEKMFSKGSAQEVDADGCPKMEKYILRKAFDCAPDGKVGSISRQDRKGFVRVYSHDISSRLIFLGPSSGGRRSNSPTVWDTRGLMGMRLCSRMQPRSCTNSPCPSASRTTPRPSCLMRPSRSGQNAGQTARLTRRKRTSSATSSTVRLVSLVLL